MVENSLGIYTHNKSLVDLDGLIDVFHRLVICMIYSDNSGSPTFISHLFIDL